MLRHFIPRNDNKVFAFTLAEVLITLVIIGVIAALTIPNLIAKHDKEQTVTKLKKVYSTIQFTINRAIADNGPVQTWDLTTPDENGKIALRVAEQYLFPYLKVRKKCTSYVNECLFNRNYLNNQEFQIQLLEPSSKYTVFFLNDGTLIAFLIWGRSEHLEFFVDINGTNKPNTFGKDVFLLTYGVLGEAEHTKINQLGPIGFIYPRSTLSGTSSGWACSNGKNGYYCGALIMKDGWKISDDYPW